MKPRLVLLLILLIAALPNLATAQGKPPEKPSVPIVATEDSLTLANYILDADNHNFKIKELAAELATIQDAFNAKLQSMQKPGFHLERDAKTKAFTYVADPPKPTDAAKPAEKK